MVRRTSEQRQLFLRIFPSAVFECHYGSEAGSSTVVGGRGWRTGGLNTTPPFDRMLANFEFVLFGLAESCRGGWRRWGGGRRGAHAMQPNLHMGGRHRRLRVGGFPPNAEDLWSGEELLSGKNEQISCCGLLVVCAVRCSMFFSAPPPPANCESET